MSRQVSVSAEVGQVVLPFEGQADNENSGKEKKRRAKAPTRKAGLSWPCNRFLCRQAEFFAARSLEHLGVLEWATPLAGLGIRSDLLSLGPYSNKRSGVSCWDAGRSESAMLRLFFWRLFDRLSAADFHGAVNQSSLSDLATQTHPGFFV